MKTKITAELMLAIIAIFLGNEIITALIPNNPTEHLVACLGWVAGVTTVWTTRAISHVLNSVR